MNNNDSIDFNFFILFFNLLSHIMLSAPNCIFFYFFFEYIYSGKVNFYIHFLKKSIVQRLCLVDFQIFEIVKVFLLSQIESPKYSLMLKKKQHLLHTKMVERLFQRCTLQKYAFSKSICTSNITTHLYITKLAWVLNL